MNQVGMPKPATKKPNSYVNPNVMEAVRGIGTNIGTTTKNEFTQNLPDNFLRDMFGADQPQSELKPNESINVQQEEEPKKVTPRDIIHALTTKDKEMTQQELNAIRQQIETIGKQTNNQEIKKVVIEQPTENPGVYHTNFFKRILETAQQLGKPDDFLTEFNKAGTKRKRLGFWSRTKTNGSSYNLSGERTAATQSG